MCTRMCGSCRTIQRAREGVGQEYILVNPKIVKYGKQSNIFTKGCLSFLTLQADVEQPLLVRVEAQDLKGKKFDIILK